MARCIPYAACAWARNHRTFVLNFSPGTSRARVACDQPVEIILALSRRRLWQSFPTRLPSTYSYAWIVLGRVDGPWCVGWVRNCINGACDTVHDRHDLSVTQTYSSLGYGLDRCWILKSRPFDWVNCLGRRCHRIWPAPRTLSNTCHYPGLSRSDCEERVLGPASIKLGKSMHRTPDQQSHLLAIRFGLWNGPIRKPITFSKKWDIALHASMQTSLRKLARNLLLVVPAAALCVMPSIVPLPYLIWIIFPWRPLNASRRRYRALAVLCRGQACGDAVLRARLNSVMLSGAMQSSPKT